MPSLKTIRRRITSVKSTQKITRAMKMVAAARLRRAQQRIVELRPYAQKTRAVLQSVASKVGPEAHSLLQEREVKSVLLVVFTGDRGLSGGFNSSIIRATERKMRELEAEGKRVELAILGRKGRDHFKRRGATIRHDFVGSYEGGAGRAAEIARLLSADYTAEEPEVDQVFAIFNEFKSAMTQVVNVQQVLPIVTPKAEAELPGTSIDYIYEPSREALLNTIVPMYVEVSIFRAMLESLASAYGAQMTAMDNATNNAKKMIAGLTLEYNRARQAAITKELMEIIGGSEALKD